MNTLQRFEQWGDLHHPKWVDIIRIALGIFLCYKGIQFLQNMSDMLGIMAKTVSFGSFTIVMLSNYVAFSHLLGGALLILGMLTRFACLLQIPILLGAVFLVNGTAGNLLKPFSELYLSILVLLLLIYFLIAGNGPWSLKLSSEKGKE